MTFDDRLNRLTERHEALAQSLELLTADVQSLQATVKMNWQYIEALTRSQAKLTDSHERLVDAMTKLTTIVTSHEQRIQRLES